MTQYARSTEAPRRARLAAHVLSGVITATLVGTGDITQAHIRSTAAHVSGLDTWGAFLIIVGLMLPLGLAAGLLSGLADVAAPPSVDARRAFALWTTPSSWFRREPNAWADVLTTLLVATAFLAAMRAVAFALATGFHDQRLASSVAAVLALVVVSVAAVTFRITRRLLRGVAKRIGPLAAPILLIVAAAIGAYLAVKLTRGTRFARGDWYTPVSAMLAVLLHSSLSASLSVTARAHVTRIVGLGLVAFVCACTVPSVAVSRYTASSRLRILTEDFSRLGRGLVPAYQRVLDRDGDGYSPVLGGGDCNDGRASVHPGAADPRGDGVDADCFAGDGTPAYVDPTPVLWGEAVPVVNTPRNILLITIDALRPDHLGTFGYERATSPNIDRFAREAVRFADVTAQAPRTMRSMPAALTGKYPTQIAFGAQHVFPDLLPSNVTLAELLSPTHGSAVVMATSYFENVPSIFQGFTQIVLSDRQKADRGWAVDRTIERIDGFANPERPWFVWTHLFNVHEPTLADGAPSHFDRGPIGSYDTEVVLADAEVGRLLDHLRARRIYDDTIIIIASDHGEALGEHGMWGHSSSLNVEQVASVLIVKAPTIPPRLVREPVALMDLFPTIANLAGMPRQRHIAGRSLVPAMRGDASHLARRDIFAEVVPDGLFPFDWKSIRRGNLSLIYWPDTARVALYDRARDPHERNDIADARPRDTQAMLRTLKTWMLSANPRETLGQSIIADARVHAIPQGARHIGLRYATGFVLEAVEVEPAIVRPGATVVVDFYFRVLETTVQDCFIDVFPVAPPGVTVPNGLHLGHYPVDGHYRTNRFRRGEIIRDRVSLRIPRSTTTPLSIPFSIRVLGTDRAIIPWEQEGRTGDTRSLLTLEIR